jgi:hypothetical protein
MWLKMRKQTQKRSPSKKTEALYSLEKTFNEVMKISEENDINIESNSMALKRNINEKKKHRREKWR